MSIPESVLREIERAIQEAEFPRGMSVHDGKAKVHSSHLRRLLAELAALRIENDALRAELQREVKNKKEFERDWLDACDRLSKAEAALKSAPHDPLCATHGGIGPCNCWKRAALGER